MRKKIIGVMGPGEEATDHDKNIAYKLGRLIAKQGWILLSGGRNLGVMDAVNRGAKDANGLTVGIMPTSEPETISKAVDIAIITEMKSARNNINVLSSDVVIACGMGAGTASEIALALKAKKKVILLDQDEETKNFFQKIGKNEVYICNNPEDAIEITKKIIKF